MGEQIDGSIKYDGEHYIIEAKWHDKWSASDSLYQFAAKVEGKMYGRGLFISVNGFSPDSVQALTTGKVLRTILVDGGDLVPITIFIPMPFLLNHHLHMNCVISKFKLGNEFVTDFAYLTKSSDYWEFVLVELEDAKMKIFTNDKENLKLKEEQVWKAR